MLSVSNSRPPACLAVILTGLDLIFRQQTPQAAASYKPKAGTCNQASCPIK